MGPGRRAVLYIARPIYRKFFERPLWWFLAKVKMFFLAEISERLLLLDNKIEELKNLQQSSDQRLRNADANNAAQWDATEQLILAMFRQRERRIWDVDQEDSALRQTAPSTSD